MTDAAHPGLTLGVMTGPVADLAGQVQDKLKVVTAMRSKLAVAQDPQTEHVLNKDCLNVSRVNHILRVHAKNKSGSSRASRKRALCRRLWGLGWRTATGTARAANIGGIRLAAPKVRAMASAAANAGLLDHGLIERLLEVKARQVAGALMSELHDGEKVKAAAFLKNAEEAFENQWKRIITGGTGNRHNLQRGGRK